MRYVRAFLLVYFSLAILAAILTACGSDHQYINGDTQADREHTRQVMQKQTEGSSKEMRDFRP